MIYAQTIDGLEVHINPRHIVKMLGDWNSCIVSLTDGLSYRFSGDWARKFIDKGMTYPWQEAA